ncbi:MAG TPA: hypothetical protein VG838_05390 [Opitutaceae bacterium]|nr:hypothetical protein [Opitutaceae bacterium]
MSSRLDELRRQRALLQGHLAWLDREILAAGADEPAPVSKSAFPFPLPTPAPRAVPPPADADELLARLQAEEEKNRPSPTKTGCWIVFSVVMMALAGVILGLVYFVYR